MAILFHLLENTRQVFFELLISCSTCFEVFSSSAFLLAILNFDFEYFHRLGCWFLLFTPLGKTAVSYGFPTCPKSVRTQTFVLHARVLLPVLLAPGVPQGTHHEVAAFPDFRVFDLFLPFFFPVVVDERGCFEHELCKNIRYFYKCALLCHFYFFHHSGWGRTLPHSWSLSKLIHGKVPQSSHGAAHLFAQMTALLSHQSSCFFETSIRLWSQRVIGKEFPPCQRFRKDWRESADRFLRALQDFSGFHGIKYPLRLGRVKWKQAALTVCTWRDNG